MTKRLILAVFCGVLVPGIVLGGGDNTPLNNTPFDFEAVLNNAIGQSSDYGSSKKPDTSYPFPKQPLDNTPPISPTPVEAKTFDWDIKPQMQVQIQQSQPVQQLQQPVRRNRRGKNKKKEQYRFCKERLQQRQKPVLQKPVFQQKQQAKQNNFFQPRLQQQQKPVSQKKRRYVQPKTQPKPQQPKLNNFFQHPQQKRQKRRYVQPKPQPKPIKKQVIENDDDDFDFFENDFFDEEDFYDDYDQPNEVEQSWNDFWYCYNKDTRPVQSGNRWYRLSPEAYSQLFY